MESLCRYVRVRTSKPSVNFNVTTRRYIPEDSKLHYVFILYYKKFAVPAITI
jgi:hypothetical protein